VTTLFAVGVKVVYVCCFWCCQFVGGCFLITYKAQSYNWIMLGCCSLRARAQRCQYVPFKIDSKDGLLQLVIILGCYSIIGLSGWGSCVVSIIWDD